MHEAVRLSHGAPLVVNGTTVDVAGLISLEPTEGSSLHVGDRYYLIDTDAPVTTTATIRALAFPQLAFAPLVVPGEGLYAVVTAAPEPSRFGLVAGAALLLLRRRRA